MIEQWITEVCLEIGCCDDLQILNYTHFLDRSIDFAMQVESRSKRHITFISYLLKIADLEKLKPNAGYLNSFDIIVLEETHALDPSTMHDIIKGFVEMSTEKARKTKFWITSNTEREALSLPSFTLSPSNRPKQDNLRNVPAVAKLAEAINTDVGPERYPSVVLSIPSIKCHINTAYEFEGDEEKRLQNVVEEAKRWKNWLPKCSLLFIDCENSTLYEKLKAEGIPIKTYKDNYNIGEPLFLQTPDPIEAIVAGAEWHVLIVHITVSTLNSIKMVKLFNKRVISGATTKVIIFSDRDLQISPEKNADTMGEKKYDMKVEEAKILDGKKTAAAECPDEFDGHNLDHTISEEAPKYESDIRVSRTTDVNDLIEYVTKLHSNLASSGEKLSHHQGYDFAQIRYLDDSWANQRQDIYLVYGQGKAFIVQLNSYAVADVLRAQKKT